MEILLFYKNARNPNVEFLARQECDMNFEEKNPLPLSQSVVSF